MTVIFNYVFNVSPDFISMNRRWCKSDQAEKEAQHHSLFNAKEACNKDEKCEMFYDIQSKNTSFILCASSITQYSDEGSTIYVKCKDQINT